MTRLIKFILYIAVLGLIQMPLTWLVLTAKAIPFEYSVFVRDGALIIYSISIFGSALYTHWTKDKIQDGLFHVLSMLCGFVIVGGALFYGIKLSDAIQNKTSVLFEGNSHYLQATCAGLALLYYFVIEFGMPTGENRKYSVVTLHR